VKDRYELVLAGTGGQGTILAGVILGDAAATYDGKNAAQTAAYGPAARGGFCKSEVVISDVPIDYPKVSRADLLLAMSQEAYDEYGRDLCNDGLLILDSDLVLRVPERPAYCVPITRVAEEKVGRALAANIVALGLVVGLTGVVSPKAVRAALASRAPKGSEEVNFKALQAGLDLAEELKMDVQTAHDVGQADGRGV
jgi:2-oxoglutarate ferredoxin oxidoreductase subunit gamma